MCKGDIQVSIGPYYSISFKKTSDNMFEDKCLGTTTQMLKLAKRAKMEHLSSIAIGYSIFQKHRENIKYIKRLKI
jgi:hypothetical protein